MSSSPDTYVGRTCPRTRSVTQSIEEELTVRAKYETAVVGLTGISVGDTMPYPYSKYGDGSHKRFSNHMGD